eukprot:gene10192-21239_t
MKAQCGSWLPNYALVQSKMMSESAPKYVISIAGKSGISDNLTGMVTHFLYALLTNRIFLRLSFGQITPHLETVYVSPNINWTSFHIPEFVYKCMKPPYTYYRTNRSGIIKTTTSKCTHQKTHLTVWNNMRFYPLDLINSDHDGIFLYSNLKKHLHGNSDAEVILISGHRGRVYATFRNTHHKTDLARMDLTPQTAFPCLFNYLFRLQPDACSSQCQTIKNSLITSGQNNILRIGIHIRIKDAIFKNGTDVTLESAKFHLQCAEKIVSHLPPNQKWIFFMVTNSRRLRVLVKEKYEDRMITDTTSEPLHIDCTKNPNCTEESNRSALRVAASDLMLLSLADVHIITSSSGFGVIASMMKTSTNHSIFRVDRFRGRSDEDCQLGREDTLESVTQDWSGI